MPTPTPSSTPYPNLFGVDWPTSILIALTLATVLLAAVAIVLVFGGIFAFLNVRRDAREQAEKTAKETSEKLAEEAANRYLQNRLPEIIAAYAEMMSSTDATTASQADEIAEEESSET